MALVAPLKALLRMLRGHRKKEAEETLHPVCVAIIHHPHSWSIRSNDSGTYNMGMY